MANATTHTVGDVQNLADFFRRNDVLCWKEAIQVSKWPLEYLPVANDVSISYTMEE